MIKTKEEMRTKHQLPLTSAQEEKLRQLMQEMTLEEKLGQMNLPSVSIVGGFDVSFEELIEMLTDGKLSHEEFGKIMASAQKDYHEEDIRAGLVGSMMVQEAAKANELQKIAIEESRLGIPLLIGLDVIHGFRSVFPIAIAEAGAFDTDLFERTAGMAARESRTQGINWHFAPMLDVARDSRWGRVSEGPGEDPYLGAQFGRAKIRGLQNDRSDTKNYVAACLKHYVAYGACEAGRDYNTVSMADSLLHNVYLPPFQAAISEGAATVMASFNDLNGVPCTINTYTLRDILKKQYGFSGFVVSDANAIKECIVHGAVKDECEAGCAAIQAGMDVDMGTNIYKNQVAGEVAKNPELMQAVNEAVERILRVKFWLGLFEHPYVEEEHSHSLDVLPKEHVELVREAAQKSAVLLKNEDQLLPIKKGTKVSLVGELADMASEVVGAWALSWRAEDCISIRQGFLDAGAEFSYFACGGPSMEINEEDIQKAGEYGDVIVAVVGELVSMSGEAASRADIILPNRQRELLQKLLDTGKPVIAVLMNGRPLALDWEAKHIPAILESWHLGIEMGHAVCDLLYGRVNPEGRLASTIPYTTGQCPIYYNHPKTGRPGGKSKFSSKYIDAPFEALYPFGYGLSYTNYQYEDLRVEVAKDTLEVSVNVSNVGDKDGRETVQLYIADPVASLVRPVKELRAFAKVELKAGEQKTVQLSVKKEDLGFYDNAMQYHLEDGEFIIYVGGNSKDCLSETVELTF